MRMKIRLQCPECKQTRAWILGARLYICCECGRAFSIDDNEHPVVLPDDTTILYQTTTVAIY